MHLIADRARHRDATGFGQRLKARRDIDAVAHDVVAVDDDIAEIDANPERNAIAGGLVCVSRRHCTLNVDRAAQGGIRAAEFDQHPIAGGLDDAPAVFVDLGVEQGCANLAQARYRPRVVVLHVPAESDDIGNENGDEPAGDWPLHAIPN